jgi:hypothetical protein
MVSRLLRNIFVRRFDRERYVREMLDLVARGCAKLRRERPYLRVYTVSIWTDPDAAASAINFDTLAHSRAQVEAFEVYRAETREELLRAGRIELAGAWERPARPRNENPADFLLRWFADADHWSVPRRWEERSGGACWAELKPALDEVAGRALPMLAELDLEVDAILGVNGRKDWFERTWPIRREGGRAHSGAGE